MSLFTELKRRNVFRVAAAYVVVGWLLLQVADVLLGNFGAPGWVFKSFAALLALGFPLALFLAWAFELTPDGVKRAEEVDAEASITPRTGRRIDRLIIVALAGVIIVMAAERFWIAGNRDAPRAEESGTAQIDKSIAVLPFSDFSPGGDSQWFADGLSEEILNSLVRVPDLLVAARTSSFSFRDSNRPIPEIATELGVAHVLEGSVRVGSNRVRVTAQLIRAADGFHVWSDTFDRDMADMIGIQENLARRIAPGFSQAHFRAARFWMIQSDGARIDRIDTGLDAEAMSDRFIERIDAAIETVTSDAQRLSYRGLKARFQLRFRDAVALFDAYLEKRPDDIEAWGQLMGLGGILRDDSIVLRAIEAVRPAATRNSEAASSIASAAHRLNDPALAAAQVERVVPLLGRFPQAADFHYQLHRALLWVGRVDEARGVHDRIFRAGLETVSPAVVRLRQACAEGRLEEAQRIFETEVSDDRTDQWLGASLIGRTQQAYEALQVLDDSGHTYALASYLIYPQFDATRFPSLMRVLDAEGLEPHPVRPIPFACRKPGPVS